MAKYILVVPLGGFLLGVEGPQLARRILKRDPLGTSLGLFLCVVLISTIFSTDRQLSIYGESHRYVGLVSLLICCLVFANFNRPESNHKDLSFVITICGFGSSLYVYLQYLGLDPFVWTTESFSGSVTGLLGNPNSSSALIAVSMPFSISAALCSQRKIQRVLWGAYFLFAAYTIGLTGSFIGVNQIFGTLAVVLWLSRITERQKWSTRVQVSAFCLVALSAYLSVTASTMAFVIALSTYTALTLLQFDLSVQLAKRSLLALFPLVIVLFFTMRSSVTNGIRTGFLERGDFYRTALGIARDHPLFGSGLETYGRLFTRYRPDSHAITLEDSVSNSAHNMYLSFLSNAGPLALLSFLLIVCVALKRSFEALRSREEPATYRSGSLGALIVFLFVALFSVDNLALLLIGFALLGANASSGTENRRRKQDSDTSSLLNLVIAGVLALTSLLLVSRPLFEGARLMYKADATILTGANGSDALPLISKAFSWTPWDGYRQLRLGEAQIAEGNYIEGRENLVAGLRKDGYSPLSIRIASTLLYQQQDFEGALTVIEASLPSSNSSPNTLSVMNKVASDIYTIAQNSGDAKMGSRALALKNELNGYLEQVEKAVVEQ